MHATYDNLTLRFERRQLADAPPERPMPSDAWRGHYEEYSRRGLPTGASVPDR